MRSSLLNFLNQISLGAILCALVLTACGNEQKSENNSTGVEYNIPAGTDDAGATTPATSGETNYSDTGSYSGRTSAGGRRRGKVTVSAVPVREVKREAIRQDEEGTYNYAETAPMFQGGQAALAEFINDRLEYPEDAINNEIEGTIMIEFSIDENGKVVNPTVVGQPLGYGLEEAAIRAITTMPAWTPGKVRGKNVRVRYKLPITFRLED
ncbi:MAG TPA: TonB family protein [Chitinophagaceae bacterium]|nr:TonB family protein [Chitinophagaceae bacterium]